jgi:hypothetical protein
MPEQIPSTAYEQVIADLRRSLRARPAESRALRSDVSRPSPADVVGRPWPGRVGKVFRPAS